VAHVACCVFGQPHRLSKRVMAIDTSAFVESSFIVLACNESIAVPVSVQTFMMLAFGMSVLGSMLVFSEDLCTPTRV